MKKIFFLLLLAVSVKSGFGQVEANFNPIVYTKPLPSNITVVNQPNDFKFTTHLVNIKIPSDSANIWSVEMERRYIKRLFNYVKDVDCLILNYSGFYFDESLGLGSLKNGFSHEFNIQNKIRNIGLSLFNNSSQYNSNKLLQIIRLSEDFGLRPQIVTHEFYHLWNSYLVSANYWLIDPSNHTGLVEEDNSVFYGYSYDFQHVSDSIYSYKQGFCTGFPGKLEGYLAGLWDMPNSLRTLKNFYNYSNLPFEWVFDSNGDISYGLQQVKADSIVVLDKTRLFNMYGGERIPNYINANNNYDCAVIVFSLNDFLNDNKLKGFHYSSILNEFEGTSTEYNNLYDQICVAGKFYSDVNYGKRQTNPYHSSYKKLHFKTRLFNDDGSVNSVPNAAGIITGSTVVCKTATNLTYSIPVIKYATSYIWTLPTGATGTSTTNSIIVSYGISAVSGNITVKGHNLIGDGEISTLAITLSSLPGNAGTITGITTVCQRQTSVTYTLPPIENATSYVWTLPSGATGTSTTNSITVSYGTSAVSGNIIVKGTNSCGDGATSSFAVTVNNKPMTPIISLNGNVLYSDAPSGNQWYGQNGFINGATNQDYTVSINGDYYVIVTLLGCSSDASNILNVIHTGIEVTENNKTIKIYPNPVSNELIIEIEGNNRKVNFEILNLIGQVVFKGNLTEKTVVQTSSFAPGVYVIKLENGKTFEFKKIVKE